MSAALSIAFPACTTTRRAGRRSLRVRARQMRTIREKWGPLHLLTLSWRQPIAIYADTAAELCAGSPSAHAALSQRYGQRLRQTCQHHLSHPADTPLCAQDNSGKANIFGGGPWYFPVT